MLFGFENVREDFSCLNLASEGVTNVRFIAEEVARQMGEATGVKPEVVFGEGDRGWVGDVPYTHLDGSKFAAYGWKARMNSDEAVRQAIREVISEKVRP
jgi:UDP-glucose 4-epimerase